MTLLLKILKDLNRLYLDVPGKYTVLNIPTSFRWYKGFRWTFFSPSGCSHYIRLSTSLTQRDFKIGDIKIQRAEAKVIEIQHHADNWIITLMKFLHWLKVRVRPSLILKSLSQTWKCVRTGGSFLYLGIASWRNLLPHRHSPHFTHHFRTWQL